MKLALNRDYANRHLFVTLLMLGLALWFGYDGFIRYPATPARELYRQIEKTDPSAEWTDARLEAFKHQKTQTQYGFTLLTFLVALIVGGRLLSAARFSFSFEDRKFTVNGASYDYSDIRAINRDRWQAKGILALTLADGKKIILDAWHHQGVKDFEETIREL